MAPQFIDPADAVMAQNDAFGAAPQQMAQAQPQRDVWSSNFRQLSPDELKTATSQQSSMGGLPPELADLQGDDFINALAKTDPSMAQRVKRVGEGREAYPTGFALKAPMNQFLMAALGQAYPGFAQQDFKSRQDTIDAYTPKGVEGRRLIAANQAILHANSALKASQELGGSNFLPGIVNPVRNLVEGQLSPDFQRAKSRYEQFITATGEELTNAFRGRGGGTQEEINNWRKNALAADSPASREAAIQAGMELLHGSLTTMANAYDQGMRSATMSKDPRDFIYAPNRPIFEKLLGHAAGGTTSAGFYGEGGQPAPGTQQRDEQYPIQSSIPQDALIAEARRRGLMK